MASVAPRFSCGRAATLCLPLCALVGASTFKANTFLHQRNKSELQHLSKDFLSEIENILGKDHRGATEKRLAPLETLLRPTLESLPVNSDGRYEHMAVQYALHRLFQKRHGWFIKSLNVGTDEQESSSPTDMFGDQVPDYLQSLFEARLGAHGLSSHDVALLAALFENLVHREASDRLSGAYTALGISNSSKIDKANMEIVLDTYMAKYLFEGEEILEGFTTVHLVKMAPKIYASWAHVQKFVREVLEDRAGDRTAYSFDDVADVVESIADRYGRFQNTECREITREVLDLHDDGTGLVPLSKFYAAGLESRRFTESVGYLRKIGALNESVATNLRVRVTNFVLGKTNCAGHSAYYVQCCMNQCEVLMEHIEHEIKESSATPERLIQIVGALDGSGAPADRSLSPKLVERLHAIAQQNHGRVSLHGRVFAQWMHYAYPMECPFPGLPHGDGMSDLDIVSSDYAMKGTLELMNMTDTEASSEITDWFHVESEQHYAKPNARKRRTPTMLRAVIVLVAVASFGRLLWHSFNSLIASQGADLDKMKIL